jgi:hypothetical protein
MNQVYYNSLVRWEILDEIVAQASPAEHQAVRELILKTLDHAVLEAVFGVLPESLHESFLEKCEQEYHHEELLDWLEQYYSQIRPHLKTVIKQTKVEIREIITLEMTK